MTARRRTDLDPTGLRLGELGPRLVRTGAAVGAFGLAAALLLGWAHHDQMRRFFYSYLVATVFFTTIAIGALFFVLLQHLTRARWSVVVRRVAEILTATFPLLGVLVAAGILLPLLLGADSLYLWSRPIAAGDHALEAKAGWLSPPAFALRCVAYFVVFTLLSRYFFARSVAQDHHRDPDLVARLRQASAPAMIAFAFATMLAGFDLLMSLDPYWYSTMYGVYFFAGAAVAVFAALAVIPLWLRRRGVLADAITVEHYHDIGKLLFAFVFFWGYIAFSQFMLIWYADLPEETRWLEPRLDTGWSWLSLILLVGHFCLPFLFLLSRETKRRLPVLLGLAGWMLVMHYCDLFWLVMPEYQRTGVSFGPIDLTALAGVGGLFVAAAARAAGRVFLIPIGDPRLDDSLEFESS